MLHPSKDKINFDEIIIFDASVERLSGVNHTFRILEAIQTCHADQIKKMHLITRSMEFGFEDFTNEIFEVHEEPDDEGEGVIYLAKLYKEAVKHVDRIVGDAGQKVIPVVLIGADYELDILCQMFQPLNRLELSIFLTDLTNSINNPKEFPSLYEAAMDPKIKLFSENLDLKEKGLFLKKWGHLPLRQIEAQYSVFFGELNTMLSDRFEEFVTEVVSEIYDGADHLDKQTARQVYRHNQFDGVDENTFIFVVVDPIAPLLRNAVTARAMQMDLSSLAMKGFDVDNATESDLHALAETSSRRELVSNAVENSAFGMFLHTRMNKRDDGRKAKSVMLYSPGFNQLEVEKETYEANMMRPEMVGLDSMIEAIACADCVVIRDGAVDGRTVETIIAKIFNVPIIDATNPSPWSTVLQLSSLSPHIFVSEAGKNNIELLAQEVSALMMRVSVSAFQTPIAPISFFTQATKESEFKSIPTIVSSLRAVHFLNNVGPMPMMSHCHFSPALVDLLMSLVELELIEWGEDCTGFDELAIALEMIEKEEVKSVLIIEGGKGPGTFAYVLRKCREVFGLDLEVIYRYADYGQVVKDPLTQKVSVEIDETDKLPTGIDMVIIAKGSNIRELTVSPVAEALAEIIGDSKCSLITDMREKDVCSFVDYLFSEDEDKDNQTRFFNALMTNRGSLLISGKEGLICSARPSLGGQEGAFHVWPTHTIEIIKSLVMPFVMSHSGRHPTQIEALFDSTVSVIEQGLHEDGAFLDFGFNGYDLSGLLTMILTLDYMRVDTGYLTVIACGELSKMNHGELLSPDIFPPRVQRLVSNGYDPEGLWNIKVIERLVDYMRPVERSSAKLELVDLENVITASWCSTWKIAMITYHGYRSSDYRRDLPSLYQSLVRNGVLIAPDFRRPIPMMQGHTQWDFFQDNASDSPVLRYFANPEEVEVSARILQEDCLTQEMDSLYKSDFIGFCNAVEVVEVKHLVSKYIKRYPQFDCKLLLMPVAGKETQPLNESTQIMGYMHELGLESITLLTDVQMTVPILPDGSLRLIDYSRYDNVFEAIADTDLYEPDDMVVVLEDGVEATTEAFVWLDQILKQLDFDRDRSGMACAVSPIAQDSGVYATNLSSFFPAMGLWGIKVSVAKIIATFLKDIKAHVADGYSISGVEFFSEMIMGDHEAFNTDEFPSIYAEIPAGSKEKVKPGSLKPIFADCFRRLLELYLADEIEKDNTQALTWLAMSMTNQHCVVSGNNLACDSRLVYRWKAQLLPKNINDKIIHQMKLVFDKARHSSSIDLPVQLGPLDYHHASGGLMYSPLKFRSFLTMQEEFYAYVHGMQGMLDKVTEMIQFDQMMFEPTRKSFPFLAKLLTSSLWTDDPEEYKNSMVAAWQSLQRFMGSRVGHSAWAAYLIYESHVDMLIAHNMMDVLCQVQPRRMSMQEYISTIDPIDEMGMLVNPRAEFPPIVEEGTRHGFLMLTSADYDPGYSEFFNALLELNSEILKVDVIVLAEPDSDNPQHRDVLRAIAKSPCEFYAFGPKEGESLPQFIGRVVKTVRMKKYDCGFFLGELSLSINTNLAMVMNYQIATQHFVFDTMCPVSTHTSTNTAVFSTKMSYPRKDKGGLEHWTEKMVCMADERALPIVYKKTKKFETIKDEKVKSNVACMNRSMQFCTAAPTIVTICRAPRLSIDGLKTLLSIVQTCDCQLLIVLRHSKYHGNEGDTASSIREMINESLENSNLPPEKINIIAFGHDFGLSPEQLAQSIERASLYIDLLWSDPTSIVAPYLAKVPVLTIEGDYPAYRLGSSFNRSLGHESLISRSWPELQEKAIELMGDRHELRSLRERFAPDREDLPFYGQFAVDRFCGNVLAWVERFCPVVKVEESLESNPNDEIDLGLD